MKLNIGGSTPAEGWKIFDIQPAPHVDIVGDCTDLAQFPTSSISEIYASHVLEHLGFREALPQALREWHRVLQPDGILRVAVPDMTAICGAFNHPELGPKARFWLLRVIYGGQDDPYDFHRWGFTLESLTEDLKHAGFHKIVRVKDFGLFDDSSRIKLGPTPISLNVQARKPATPGG